MNNEIVNSYITQPGGSRTRVHQIFDKISNRLTDKL